MPPEQGEKLIPLFLIENTLREREHVRLDKRNRVLFLDDP
jgi:hypothetical protein